MNLSSLETALASAWERKRSLQDHVEAVRLLNARASGTPRLVFELYGKHGILYDYGNGGDWTRTLPTAASNWCKEFGWESVSWLDRTVANAGARSGNHAVAGQPPETLVVREGALRFRVEPGHPRNVGLFLDTRALRQNLATQFPARDARERGPRVLNLFAYTGSLGIAALAGEASEVVQVDISARYLDWGRDNLRLNNLPGDRCRFTRMDSERYLDWAAKKNLRFDHVILDPPVFSRFEGKVFRWADDYFRLAAKCAALLSPGGVLYAVTNYAGIRPAEFASELARTFRDADIKAPPPQRMPLPEDFDLPPDAEDLPEGNAILFGVARD